METSKKELIKLYIVNNLIWENIKIMDTNQFKSFTLNFFTELDSLSKNINVKYEMIDFVNEINIKVSSANMDDSNFEIRLGFIFDELQCYCASPFFWDVEIDIYLEKWNQLFIKNLIV